MSSIAGQLSIIVGSYNLLKHNKGKGTLLGNVSDLEPRVVTVIGAGVAGTEAIKKAHSNGAYVKIIELSESRLSELRSVFGDKNIEYIKSSEKNILNDEIRNSPLNKEKLNRIHITTYIISTTLTQENTHKDQVFLLGLG